MELWIILLIAMIVLFGLGMYVQTKFRKTAVKYSAISSKNNQTGAKVAERILAENNITDVQIVRGNGNDFSDNFNPATKVVTLSKAVYDSTSITAISIAAHEVGHVIQYARQTRLIKIRTKLIKPVMIAQQVGSFIFQIGFMILLFGALSGNYSNWFGIVLVAGLIISTATFIFSLVTLPVEFDASKRAKKTLIDMEIISDKDDEEYQGVEKVLSAAAKTYLIAFLSSLTSLLFYILILLGARN